MHIFSVPRPNGSRAVLETRRAMEAWLSDRQIPFRLHTFRLYPYFFQAIGVWIIVSRSLLALAIWLRWGWAALIVAFIGLMGGLLDVAFNLPLVSWPGASRGENFLIEFSPDQAVTAQQELVISAHYDSKTELLDHRQRLFFVKNLRLGILLTVLLGVLGPLDHWLLLNGSSWSGFVYFLSIVLTLPLLFLAWGLGINLSIGRFCPPSQGAVDNGTACAILLGLAERLASRQLSLQKTHLTLAIFAGEEVNMQGSRAYAAERAWPLPAAALNLEVMAQDGDYVFWEQDGTSLGLVSTSPQLNQAIAQAVKEVTGKPARGVGPINSDGFSFIHHGIPATTLGTYDTRLVDRGFHLPSDNLGRVVMERIPEGVEILACFIEDYDQRHDPIID